MVAIPGYRVAGKTGTANRFDDAAGGYSGYTVSFIGYAPAEAPEFVVSVTLQKPALEQPSSGGLTGPVFKSVMTYALQAYRVPPTGGTSPQWPLTSPTPLVPGAPGVVSDRKPNG
jgi:cell division protein FtsI (penicillin-binding protein 3)